MAIEIALVNSTEVQQIPTSVNNGPTVAEVMDDQRRNARRVLGRIMSSLSTGRDRGQVSSFASMFQHMYPNMTDRQVGRVIAQAFARTQSKPNHVGEVIDTVVAPPTYPRRGTISFK